MAGESAGEGSVNPGGMSGRSAEAEPVWLLRFQGNWLDSEEGWEASLDVPCLRTQALPL